MTKTHASASAETLEEIKMPMGKGYKGKKKMMGKKKMGRGGFKGNAMSRKGMMAGRMKGSGSKRTPLGKV